MMHMCGSKQAHLLTAPVPSPARTDGTSTTAPPPALAVPMISLPASPLPLPPLQRRSSASLSSMPSSQRSSLPTTPGHHLPSPSLASWGRGHDDFDAKSQQRSSAPPMTVFLDAASPVSGCSTTVHSYRSRSSSQALLPPTQRTSPVGPAFVRAPRPPTDVDDHCEQKSSQRGSHRPSILSDTTAGLVFGGNPDTASEVGFIPAMPCFQIRVSSPSESSSEFVLPPCAVASTSTTTTKGPVPTRSSCSRRASISSAPSFLQVTSTAATPAKMQRFDAAICEPGTAHTSRSDIHLNDDTDDGHPSGSVLNETVACAPLAMELIHFDSPLAECPEEDLPEPPRVSRHRHSQRHREAIRTSIPLIDIVPADEHSTSSSAPSVPLTPVSVDIALPQNVMVMQGSPVLTLRMPAEIPTLRLD